VNTSTEGIDESLHGLGGIEEIPSNNGVFSRTQKLRFEETRDYGGFGTRLEGLETLQRVTQSLGNNPSSRAQESTKENQNSSQTKHKKNEIETRSTAKRAQGGKGLLSHAISVQVSQIHPSNPKEERKNKREERRGRRQPSEGAADLVYLWRKERERERERERRGYL